MYVGFWVSPRKAKRPVHLDQKKKKKKTASGDTNHTTRLVNMYLNQKQKVVVIAEKSLLDLSLRVSHFPLLIFDRLIFAVVAELAKQFKWFDIFAATKGIPDDLIVRTIIIVVCAVDRRVRLAVFFSILVRI